VLGFDPREVQRELETKYPARGVADEIEWSRVQWVDGDNDALHYRGRELKRGKIWLQEGQPREVGFRRYYYTGWQWSVLQATASVSDCPEVAPIAEKYNAWVAGLGYDKVVAQTYPARPPPLTCLPPLLCA
jgi:hypothetical protein